jgi:hypothetical protein
LDMSRAPCIAIVERSLFYVGIDASWEQLSVGLVEAKGKVIEKTKVDNQLEAASSRGSGAEQPHGARK